MSAAPARRIVGLTGAIVLLLILAGATYQGVATAVERREYPHPGKLVDIGNQQLHVYCTGEGAPSVVLEAPAAGFSAAWAAIQPQIARVTRVCSYDRAGLGWSEAGESGFHPDAVPVQLRTLLARSGERPPFVLAGHGLGAALARLDAALLGDEVLALVLVDPAHPGGARANPGHRTLMRAAPWLARMGVLRATRLLSSNGRGLPEPWHGALSTFLTRPDHLTRAAAEIAHWDEITAEAERAPLAHATIVREVRTGSPAPVRFLTHAADVERVAAAILGVLSR